MKKFSICFLCYIQIQYQPVDNPKHVPGRAYSQKADAHSLIQIHVSLNLPGMLPLINVRKQKKSVYKWQQYAGSHIPIQYD